MLRHRVLSLMAAAGSLALVSSGFTPAAAAAPGSCECRHRQKLEIELRNAQKMKRRHEEQAERLTLQEETERVRGEKAFETIRREFVDKYKRWHDVEAPVGLERVIGPSEVQYVPVGDNERAETIEKLKDDLEKAGAQLQAAERRGDRRTLVRLRKHLDKLRSKDRALCERSKATKKDLEQVKTGSVGEGISQAVHVHEDHHLRSCQGLGYSAYGFGRHAATLAREEVEAYAAGIKALQEELTQLRCDYRASSPNPHGRWIGVKCGGIGGEWTIRWDADANFGPVNWVFKANIDPVSRQGPATWGWQRGSDCKGTVGGTAVILEEGDKMQIHLSGWNPEDMPCGHRNLGRSGHYIGDVDFFIPLEGGDFCSKR